MGKLSRTKGAREELRVAKLYSFALGMEAQRELDQLQGTLGRDLRGTQPYCVQIKVGDNPSYLKAIAEAVSAVDHSHRIPVVHIRRNGGKSHVVLREEDWMTLVELLKEVL